MIFSDNTAALDAALAKAQSDLKPAVKTARGHGYSYAALEEVMEAAIEALSNNGISFIQGIEELEDGKVRCVTRLAKDGEWVTTYCPLRVASNGRNNEMQELGSAYTYGRRYALQAAVGIAPITERDFEERKAKTPPWGNDDDGSSEAPGLKLLRIMGWKEPPTPSKTLGELSDMADRATSNLKRSDILERARTMSRAEYEKAGGPKRDNWPEAVVAGMRNVNDIDGCNDLHAICVLRDLLVECQK